MEVEYPWVRITLEYYLAGLSNPVWQQQAWIEGKFNSADSFDTFDGMIHFFFDDYFTGDVREYLKITLKNEEEVETITKLMAALDAVLKAVAAEGKKSDEDHITHYLWYFVISAAREALDAFSRAEYNGFPKKAE